MPDDLTRAVARADRAALQPGVTEWGTVRRVNPDGTVTVETGRAVRTSVRAATSYAGRDEGDEVLVVHTPAGPAVIAEMGPEPDPDLTQMQGLTISPADPPAGAGWLAITTGVWALIGPPMQVWLKSASAPAPPAAAPSTLTVRSSLAGTYRSSGLVHTDYAEQGQYSGAMQYGNQTGVFWFPSGAFSPLVGKTLSAPTVRVHRRSVDHGNTHGPVPAIVWTHAAAGTQSTTPTLTGAGWQLDTQARLGETAEGELPVSVATDLRSGAVAGLAIYSASASLNLEADWAEIVIPYA